MMFVEIWTVQPYNHHSTDNFSTFAYSNPPLLVPSVPSLACLGVLSRRKGKPQNLTHYAFVTSRGT